MPRRRSGDDDSKSAPTKLKQLLTFNCSTITLCQKFQSLFDSSPSFDSSNLCSTNDPLSDIDVFSNLVDNIPFASKTKEELQILLFQLRETKNILIEVVSDRKSPINTAGEQISQEIVLNQVYCKLNEDTMAEVKCFMSCVVTIPISDAVVESWGFIIDAIIRNKVAFKESDTKLVGPLAGAISNRKLYKRALTLMFVDQDYVKHVMKPQRILFESCQ